MQTRTTLATLALVLTVAATAQEGRTVRMHDVRALDAASRVTWPLVHLNLPLRTTFLDRLEPAGWDIDEDFRLSLADAGWPRVFEALAAGDEAEDLVVRAERAGYVQIEADEAGHAFVERALASLEARLLRPVRVELIRLDGSGADDGAGAILTAAEVDALLAGGGASRVAATTTGLGKPAHLGEVDRRSVLFDYDVEVAQEAGTGDPQVSAVPDGPEFGALVLERPNGGLHLRVWGRNTIRGESRTVRGERAAVLLPACRSDLVAGSGLIEPGGGVLLGGRGADARAWLVRVVVPPAAESGLPYVPLGRLLATPLQREPLWVGQAPISGGWMPPDEDFLEGEPPYSDPELVDMLFAAEGAVDERDPWTVAAGGVLVQGSAELVARTRTRLDEWETALGGAAAVELRVGSVAAEAAATSDLAALAERLPARWHGAAVEGDTMLVVSGAERMMLVDHDVEIAHGSVAVDPIVDSLFAGTTFWCRPSATRDGGMHLWFDLRVVEHGPLESVGVDFGGYFPDDDDDASPLPTPPEQRVHFALTRTLELVEQRRVGTRGQLVVAPGEWAVALQQEMVPRSGEVVVALVRATRVR